MKTKFKFLIGLMAFSLAGTVGGALALTRNSATGTGTPGAYDKAIYLYWGSEQTETSLSDMTNLSANTAQYRYLSVTPKSSKSVTGTVTLTFTLAGAGENTHMEGLTVSVFKTDSLAADSTVAGLIEGKTATPVLDKTHLSGTATFTVSAGEAVHETNAYYAIQVVWTGAIDQQHPTYELGATVKISQSFAA